MKKVLVLLLSIMLSSAWAAEEGQIIVPYKYVKDFLKMDKALILKYPRLFQDRMQRLMIENRRLAFFSALYGIEDEARAPVPKTSKKGKKGKPQKRLPPRVYGFYKPKGSNQIFVNVNGVFKPLQRLFKGRPYQVKKVELDRVYLKVGGQTKVLEVGKRLPL